MRRERLFPWRPVENVLVPHPTCPRAVMCQSFRKRVCLIFGTRKISSSPIKKSGLRIVHVEYLFIFPAIETCLY